MKNIKPEESFGEDGFAACLALEVSDKQLATQAIIEFGRQSGAVYDEGAGELILIQPPGTSEPSEQRAYPVRGFETALDEMLD